MLSSLFFPHRIPFLIPLGNDPESNESVDVNDVDSVSYDYGEYSTSLELNRTEAARTAEIAAAAERAAQRKRLDAAARGRHIVDELEQALRRVVDRGAAGGARHVEDAVRRDPVPVVGQRAGVRGAAQIRWPKSDLRRCQPHGCPRRARGH